MARMYGRDTATAAIPSVRLWDRAGIGVINGPWVTSSGWKGRQGPGRGRGPEPRLRPDAGLEADLSDQLNRALNAVPDARRRGASGQEEAEQDTDDGVCHVQASLLHEEEDNDAEEYDSGEANDQGSPPRRPCRRRREASVATSATEPAAGTERAVRVRPRTPWTPVGGFRDNYAPTGQRVYTRMIRFRAGSSTPCTAGVPE